MASVEEMVAESMERLAPHCRLCNARIKAGNLCGYCAFMCEVA